MIVRDKSLSFLNAKKCFLPKMDMYIVKKVGFINEKYLSELDKYRGFIVSREEDEIQF